MARKMGSIKNGEYKKSGAANTIRKASAARITYLIIRYVKRELFLPTFEQFSIKTFSNKNILIKKC